MSHKRYEDLFFFLWYCGPCNKTSKARLTERSRGPSAKGKDRNTIAVEDPEKVRTTLFPPQRQSYSESPKPDFIHCSSVIKQVRTGRNREALNHYHDRGFLEQSSGLWQSTKGAFSGFTLYHGPCFIGHLPSLFS